MEDLNFWYPALLFPAIPLMMITYGNRYSSLSKLIRDLHDKALLNENDNYSTGILAEHHGADLILMQELDTKG